MYLIHISVSQRSSGTSAAFLFRTASGEDLWPTLRTGLRDRFPRERFPAGLSLELNDQNQQPFFRFSAARPVMINGVEVRHRDLRTADRLFFGSLRVRLRIEKADASEPSAEILTAPPVPAETPVSAEPPAAGRTGTAPVISPGIPNAAGGALLLLAVLTGSLMLILGRMRQDSGTAVQAPGAESVRPLQQEAEPETEPEPEITAVPGTAAAGRRTEPADETVSELSDGSGPVIVAPGAPLPEIPIDLLFIHAHPDDESLDFGILLAWCESQGLRTAVVLLTDGESGLDLYPDRQVGGDYPNEILKGDSLSRVRVKEASAAMRVLGVDLYIRLALPNHPYNGKADELTPEKVLEDWGGRETVLAGLEEIVRFYRPFVLVSPDGPAQAREHFEHEAAGLTAAAVLERLKEAGDILLPSHLICIDPRQQELYPDRVGISARGSDGTDFRQIQMKALEQHRTQGDAYFIGRRFLPGYPEESYRIRDWNLKVSWEDFLIEGGIVLQSDGRDRERNRLL